MPRKKECPNVIVISAEWIPASNMNRRLQTKSEEAFKQGKFSAGNPAAQFGSLESFRSSSTRPHRERENKEQNLEKTLRRRRRMRRRHGFFFMNLPGNGVEESVISINAEAFFLGFNCRRKRVSVPTFLIKFQLLGVDPLIASSSSS